jgi:hypothetical protein
MTGMTAATETSSAPRVVATAGNYLELIAGLRSRLAELEISYATLDALAGWTDSYATKVLGQEPQRHMGVMAFDAMINALALKVVLVDDPQKLEKIRSHRDFVTRKHRARAVGAHACVAHRVTREFLRQIGVKGGLATREKLSARRTQSDCAERRSREGSKAVTRTTFGEREQSSEG